MRFSISKSKLYFFIKIIIITITDKKYPINKVLTPSIKLDPLINTSKQKVTKKYLKIVNDSKLSKKGILTDETKFLLKNTKIKITETCKMKRL